MKKKILSTFLLFSINLICFAQDADNTVSIIVSGSGKTQDEAKQSALRSAIEQSFGAFVSSKTEIFNDQVVADQMESVSSGNIQSFTILNEAQLPDGSWGVTLRSIVSVNKLASFVESKGVVIEIKGGLFALNIKQQMLNEQSEIKAVHEMVGLLHEPMQTIFDYSIKSGDPKSLDAESKYWEIPLVVTATANKNIDFCANYCIKTLSALSLISEEVTTYKSLNKTVFPVNINYNGLTKTIFLRKQSSINALNTLSSNWEFYTRLFTAQSGMDESNGIGQGQIHDFNNRQTYNNNNKTINFLTSGQQAAIYSWQEKKTLSQIEQMTGYRVKPRGIISQYKQGGFVIYETNGHGLVASISNLGYMNLFFAKIACDELTINGYSDWRLPTREELNAIYINLHSEGIGGFSHKYDEGSSYWSSTENDFGAFCRSFGESIGLGDGHDKIIMEYVVATQKKGNVRAVRAF
ncbi:hypothetical protein VR610_10345 [Aquirufa regiilacus]